MSEAIPYIVDPIGTAIYKTTGFPYSPGAQIDKVVNPPRPNVPVPAPPPQAAPARPGAPAPIRVGGQAPQPRPASPLPPAPVPIRDPRAGAGGASDRTVGLLGGAGRRSLLS